MTPPASSNERSRILSMLSEGKITAEEANRLLATVSKSGDSGPRRKLQYVRIQVSDPDTNRVKVRVRMQLGIVKTGLKFGARIIPNVELDEHDVDFETIREAILSEQTGKIFDEVYDDDRVEIWVE